MRKKIYSTVHIYDGNLISVIYKWFMIITIIVSLVPLMFHEENKLFKITDMIILVIFIADYVLRWVSVDFKLQTKRFSPFVVFPFRFISVVDLLSVFALISSLTGWFGNNKFTEILKIFRIIRILRYSKSMHTIADILNSSKKPLFAVGSLAAGYIMFSAIIIFNVEPQTFHNFFDAVYWSAITLTTIGYGDIYPVSAIGKTVAVASSFLGIAVVVLPAGIITAEYMKRITQKNNDDEKK